MKAAKAARDRKRAQRSLLKARTVATLRELELCKDDTPLPLHPSATTVARPWMLDGRRRARAADLSMTAFAVYRGVTAIVIVKLQK